jgi:hypothetical protein
MKNESELLSAPDFFEKLQQDKLTGFSSFSIIGMVKKSGGYEKTIEFAAGGNCSNWVTIPIELIEDVEVMKIIACKDHSHPLVKLNMKPPKTPEGKIFSALFEAMKVGLEEKQYRLDSPERGYPYPDMESMPLPTTARLRGRVGGFGGFGGFGGLNELCVSTWLCDWKCTTVGNTTTCGWANCGWRCQ